MPVTLLEFFSFLGFSALLENYAIIPRKAMTASL
jgi:hypothetical protein